MSALIHSTDLPVAENAGNTVMVLHQDGRIVQCVERGDLLASAAEDLMLASSVTIGEALPQDLAAQVQNHVKRALRGRVSFCERVREGEGARTWEFMYVPQGRDKVMVVARDMSHQASELQQARRLAFEDRATGLPNREFLFDELNAAVQTQSLREGRLGVLSIHIGQIDDFGYGLNGSQLNEVLCEVAQRLALQLRGTNEPLTASMERVSVVCRSDYRQFAIVLPTIEGGDDAEAVARRVLEVLAEPVICEAGTVYVSPRIGVALFPQDGRTADSLLENAEAAMEDARLTHDACYRMFSGTIRLRMLQRLDLASELRSALEREAYELHYLPVRQALTDETTTIEALLRWPSNLLTAQPIHKILSVAERTGIVELIGEWVLRRALSDFASLRKQGHTSLRLAINLTSKELGRKDLAEQLKSILRDVDVEPEWLDFEVAEHVLMRDAQQNYTACRRLARMGAAIVIEDFGAGGCSPVMLAEGPVSRIKLARRVVGRVLDCERQRSACRAIVAAARELDVQVTGVGVESAAQAEMLREIGCDALQGFFFSQPLAAEDLPAFLDRTASQPNLKGGLA